MNFEFKDIQRVKNIDKKTFIEQFYKPQIPVVVEKLTEDWEAYDKWRFNYLKEISGDLIVPLFNNEPVKAEDGFNEPKQKMKLADYIDLLQSQPTDLRIFLFNILKEIPTLQNDFKYPDLGVKFMKAFPVLFFGGTGSNVFMHYDIDLANIFHFNFEGKKECVLVHPEEGKYMYKVPHALISLEEIDFDNPDFEKYPALKNITPLKAELNHGEMLYIPEGYWHYMKYISPCFSMSLRSVAKKPKHFAEAVYNVFFMRHFDSFMRKSKGDQWIEYKNQKAYKRTNARL